MFLRDVFVHRDHRYSSDDHVSCVLLTGHFFIYFSIFFIFLEGNHFFLKKKCVGRSSQDGDAQQQEADPLFLPQLTKLSESYHVREWDDSNMTTIPSQHRVTMQILEHWQPFQDLKLTLAVSRRAEQLRLHTHHYRCHCGGLCPPDRDGRP